MPDSACVVGDDEPGLRSMIADYLGKQGFIVRMAANGHELDDHLDLVAFSSKLTSRKRPTRLGARPSAS